jgi:hypothetical protein
MKARGGLSTPTTSTFSGYSAGQPSLSRIMSGDFAKNPTTPCYARNFNSLGGILGDETSTEEFDEAEGTTAHSSPREFKANANDIHVVDANSAHITEINDLKSNEIQEDQSKKILRNLVSSLENLSRRKSITSERPTCYIPCIEGLEIFSCTAVPGISLQDYLQRIQKYSGATLETLIVAYILIKRCLFNCDDFELNNHNIHKVLLLAVMSAMKMYEDEVLENKAFARIGGIEMTDLNALELKFFQLIDGCSFVNETTYVQTYKYLSTEVINYYKPRQ